MLVSNLTARMFASPFNRFFLVRQEAEALLEEERERRSFIASKLQNAENLISASRANLESEEKEKSALKDRISEQVRRQAITVDFIYLTFTSGPDNPVTGTSSG
jgi:hypothetical protein